MWACFNRKGNVVKRWAQKIINNQTFYYCDLNKWLTRAMQKSEIMISERQKEVSQKLIELKLHQAYKAQSQNIDES